MSDTLTNIAGSLVAEKAVGAVLDYTLDYTAGLDAGETLINSVWTATPSDLVLLNQSFTDTTVTVTVSGGVGGNWYVVSNLATGTAGDVHDGAFSLQVIDPAALGAGLNLPFPSVPGAIASLRRDRLFQIMQTFFPTAMLDGSYLLQKLVASTALIQHMLRVFLTPREMLPNTATQDEIDALTATGAVVELEPAYDYNPDLFQGNTWGFQPLRQRPIIAVHGMQFVYPTPNNTLFQIPSEWIRTDNKYGTINLLPVTASFSMPLNAFILSALGGGRMVPNFLEIRYSAGLINCARDWPDILDVILKQTVLSIFEDWYIPGNKSESTSADGLSQSTSVGLKLRDYEDIIGRKLETIRQAMFGIRLGVV